MFSKATLFFAFVAAAEFAMAIPPACMLETVNTVKQPWKIDEVCKTKGITQTMAKLCGDDTKVALAAFADLCNKEANVKVDTKIQTATSSSVKPSGTSNSTASITGSASLSASTSVVVFTTASFDSNCNCTKTAAVTSTAVFAPSGIATSAGGPAPTGPSATGPGATQSTGAAGKIGAGMAAMMLGGLGAVVALL